MNKTILLIALFFSINQSFSQKIVQRDVVIEQMVKAVSADSLQAHIKKLVSFGTRHTLNTSTDKSKGLPAAQNWVLHKFMQYSQNANGRMIAVLDTFTLPVDGKRVDKVTTTGNVMATLKGTDTNDDRIFIVSGHLDSRVNDIMDRNSDAPGANDDGSGVAAVIELARVMSKQPLSATVIFLAVVGEEQSLLGAAHTAEKAKQNKWNVDAMLNNDMIGQNTSNETNLVNNTKVRVFSEGVPLYETEEMTKLRKATAAENDSKARQLARYVKEVAERYVDQLEVVLIYRNDRFLRGGDHIPFSQRGFTAVRMCEMNENYNHQHQRIRIENGIQYGDLPEFMDFEYLRKNTCINLAVLTSLAKAPATPQNVKIDVRELSNSTRIYWNAPKCGKLKGYYVLMRETNEAQWQQKFFTDKNEITLPYSKDNYFFAVQAVNAEGNESIAVFPEIGK